MNWIKTSTTVICQSDSTRWHNGRFLYNSNFLPLKRHYTEHNNLTASQVSKCILICAVEPVINAFTGYQPSFSQARYLPAVSVYICLLYTSVYWFRIYLPCRADIVDVVYKHGYSHHHNFWISRRVTSRLELSFSLYIKEKNIYFTINIYKYINIKICYYK